MGSCTACRVLRPCRSHIRPGKGIRMSAKSVTAQSVAALVGILCVGAISGAALAADESADNPDHCKVVKLKPGEHTPSGSLSSSVTAGNGKVTAHTSGGNGVTVH